MQTGANKSSAKKQTTKKSDPSIKANDCDQLEQLSNKTTTTIKDRLKASRKINKTCLAKF